MSSKKVDGSSDYVHTGYNNKSDQASKRAADINKKVNNLVNENNRSNSSGGVSFSYSGPQGYDLNHRKPRQSPAQARKEYDDFVAAQQAAAKQPEPPSFSAEHSTRTFVDRDGRVVQMTPQQFNDYMNKAHEKVPTFVENHIGVNKCPPEARPPAPDAKNKQPEKNQSFPKPSDDNGTSNRGRQETNRENAREKLDETKANPHATPEGQQKDFTDPVNDYVNKAHEKVPTFVEDHIGVNKYPPEARSPAPDAKNEQPDKNQSFPEPSDNTGTANRGNQETNRKNAREKFDETKADPHATPDERQKAKKDFTDAVEELLKQQEHDNTPKGYRQQAIDDLQDVAQDCRAQINQAKEKLAEADKLRQKAEKAHKAADEIEQQLGNKKVKLKDKNGAKKKVPPEEGKEAADKKRSKANNYQAQSDAIKRDSGVSRWTAAKGSMANEASNQIRDVKQTVGGAALLGGIDQGAEWLKGNCDLKTAAKNTLINAGAGSLTYAVTSVGYEGVKGAITKTVTEGADKFPALGTCMKVYQASSMIYHAENAEAAFKNVSQFGLDIGGEAALLYGITFLTGGAGLVPMAGAKIGWHIVKWGVGIP